jgi:hypothetical protein
MKHIDILKSIPLKTKQPPTRKDSSANAAIDGNGLAIMDTVVGFIMKD